MPYILFDDGSIYIQEGSRFPFVCPECRAIIPFSDADTIACPKCNARGSPGEFSDVEWEIGSKQ